MAKLKRYIKLLIAYIKFKEYKFSKFASQNGLNINEIKKIKSKTFMIKKYNLIVAKNKFYFLFKSLDYLDQLKNRSNANFYFDEFERFILEINSIRLNITSKEELFIIKEIFIDQIYNYILDDECTVIDIGMNVGVASIFFALNSKVKQVIGYEPFIKTFNSALINFNLNPEIAKKIIANNVGLSDQNTTREVYYNYELKGSVGLLGHGSNASSDEIEVIRLLNFKSVYESLLKDFTIKNKIILKIDCEGDEYQIINELNKITSRLPDIIMLEWHLRGPMVIIDTLVKLNYRIFSINNQEITLGMLYCVKMQNMSKEANI